MVQYNIIKYLIIIGNLICIIYLLLFFIYGQLIEKLIVLWYILNNGDIKHYFVITNIFR